MTRHIQIIFILFIFIQAGRADEKITRPAIHESGGKVISNHSGHNDCHEKHDHNAHLSSDKGQPGDDHSGHEHAAKEHDKGHAEKEHDKEKTANMESNHSGHEHEENGSIISLTPEQRKTVKLKISKAEAGDLKTKIFLPGEVKFNRERMAQIMPRMPGFVIKILKKEGEVVKAGEALAELQSHKLGELNAEYQSALELEDKSRAEFEIKSKLRKSKAVSEMDYIKARQEYASARVARHRAEDKLASLGFEPVSSVSHSHHKDEICTSYIMKSPIGGTVINKKITIGENYADDNTKIPFVIADLSVLWLDLNARQSDLPKLRKGMPVMVRLGEGFPDINGKISYIAPSFQPGTRTVLVRVPLDNSSGRLKPGLYATGVISLSGKDKTVVVSRSAVILLAGEKVVFVPEEHGFKAVPVITGRSNNGFIEIISGIHPGDKYVSSGAFELKAVMITSGMDPHAGHGH